LSNITSNKKVILTTAFVLLVLGLYAHTVNYEMERAPTDRVFLYYLNLGYRHILPEGFDHILFVVGLCLLNAKLKTIIWQATAFTVAHSITLFLSMKNIFVLPSQVVEPVIALSILFVAIENIILNELKPWRILIVFLFGLIHGLGFASSLNEIGLPRNSFLLSIFSFNVGVELGQLTIILAFYLLAIRSFGKKQWYKKYITYPLSGLIILISAYWFIDRLT
jgi:HupE/UreJ protein